MQADHSHERRSSGEKTFASNRQLPSLTPLRGIAALWVVLYHYCGTRQYFPNLDITPHSYFLSKGYLGVDMFFMLSGFVMAHVYCGAFCEGVRPHYRDFLVARIARLYPLHVFILFLFVATAVVSQLAIGVGSGSFTGIPLTGPESLSALLISASRASRCTHSRPTIGVVPHSRLRESSCCSAHSFALKPIDSASAEHGLT